MPSNSSPSGRQTFQTGPLLLGVALFREVSLVPYHPFESCSVSSLYPNRSIIPFQSNSSPHKSISSKLNYYVNSSLISNLSFSESSSPSAAPCYIARFKISSSPFVAPYYIARFPGGGRPCTVTYRSCIACQQQPSRGPLEVSPATSLFAP
jgi:hypothetical protein